MTRSLWNRPSAWAVAIAAACCSCGVSIHDKAANGEIEVVAAMLEQDPGLLESTNTQGKARGKTPLHYAVTYGQAEVVALLLDRGAQVNVTDGTGMTPLHMAATLNRLDEAELLLAHGADIEARDVFGDTPLHAAVLFEQTPMIAWLTEHGADRYAENHDGRTPLECARHYTRSRSIAFLEHLDLVDD
ncbi:MAG TPA: ankyrin repeat domain-containing protein [Candidatus Hydrogenedentes bacterium]|nr:ankyrin repeat domain-containing protein [Candidatus Hydrogenedentota bacterium]HPG70232.1 ankyrin repeat domain-containing protein [Candidatus Hydrogenedentota bacterium]